MFSQKFGDTNELMRNFGIYAQHKKKICLMTEQAFESNEIHIYNFPFNNKSERNQQKVLSIVLLNAILLSRQKVS